MVCALGGSLGVTEVLMFSFHLGFGIFILIRIDLGNSSCAMLSPLRSWTFACQVVCNPILHRAEVRPGNHVLLGSLGFTIFFLDYSILFQPEKSFDL